MCGFVTDDPWGDRQQPLAEADFTQMLRAGVPFTSAPGTRMEYSNLGYALLGRIITNVSQQPYADTITSTLLQPLAMASSGFDVEKAPLERLREVGGVPAVRLAGTRRCRQRSRATLDRA